MQTNSFSSILKRSTLAVLIVTGLSACLSSGGDDTPEPSAVEIKVSGSVGDGPIIGADVRITATDGDLLAQLVSDGVASYDIEFTLDKSEFPLTISASGGTDLVTNQAPDFALRGVMPVERSVAIVNVNPFSTIAAELATDLGGWTQANLTSAERIVVTELNGGLDSLATSSVLSTQIDNGNIAEIVRSSEALSEIFRRTRDAVSAAGAPVTADAVIAALGSDLTDEVLDGRGGPRSNSRISAVATVVAAQVYLEVLRGELRVNGSNAMAIMDDAIDQVTTGTVSPSLDDLSATNAMLLSTRIGLVAAHATNDSADIAQLLNDVAGVRSGMDVTISRALIPANAAASLDTVVQAVANGDSNLLETVNRVARERQDSIAAGNRAPTIAGTPAPSVQAGSDYVFTPSASDPDGDSLNFSVSNLPAWATFDSATGALRGTPAAGDVGTYAGIVISVSDGELSASLPAFGINVFVDNQPPVISGSPPTSATNGDAYTFTPSASDPDGDTLTFSIQNAPAWATFDAATGQLSGTVAEGVYANIRISVSDGQFAASLPAFSINVLPDNRAPVISGSPGAAVLVGQTYAFTPTASDPDGDALVFSIVNRPSWLTFNSGDGRIIGTPQAADVGVYNNIRISVSDGQVTSNLAAFSITVEALNGAPTISGNPPAQVVVGTAYTFTPTASDPDGDNLSFSVQNLPSWASFDAANGRISGTPQAGDVGSYANIRITVSDGSESASLGPFAIEVTAMGTGSVTLNWIAPTQNEDGSALTDLAGFRIYWGPSPGNYTDSVTIDNASVTSYVVENLAPGTYVFVATAFDGTGEESAFSGATTRVVQ